MELYSGDTGLSSQLGHDYHGRTYLIFLSLSTKWGTMLQAGESLVRFLMVMVLLLQFT
jgi:hypothetical protein